MKGMTELRLSHGCAIAHLSVALCFLNQAFRFSIIRIRQLSKGSGEAVIAGLLYSVGFRAVFLG